MHNMPQLSKRAKTATDIRIRAAITFLLVQALLAWASSYQSMVTKLTPLLKYHSIIDGFIMVSTFVMVSTYSLMAGIFELLAWLLDGTTLFLMFQAITKCFDIYQNEACFSTIPQDMVTFGILAIVILFDYMQYNSLMTLKSQLSTKAEPATEHIILMRRARLLHLWSLPFAIGIMISEFILAVDSTNVEVLATPIYLHIVLDPILTYTATRNEPPMLHVLGALMTFGLLCCDIYIFTSTIPNRLSMTTYLFYKEWCLYTLILFDVCALGVRVFIAMYNPDLNDFVAAEVNKARWKIKRMRDQPSKARKKT